MIWVIGGLVGVFCFVLGGAVSLWFAIDWLIEVIEE